MAKVEIRHLPVLKKHSSGDENPGKGLKALIDSSLGVTTVAEWEICLFEKIGTEVFIKKKTR